MRSALWGGQVIKNVSQITSPAGAAGLRLYPALGGQQLPAAPAAQALLGQAVAQALPRQAQATAHRGLGLLQALGDLTGGAAVVISQLHDRALLGRQALQGPGDEAMLFPLPAELLGRSLVALPLPGGRRFQGILGALSPGLLGFMPGNATQPGSEAARGREHRGALPDHEHDFIDDLIHECSGAQVAPEKGREGWGIVVIELLEG
jgi:hypothetical protein